MARRMPHVEAAMEEAERLGAILTVININHHIKAVVKYGDKCRKVFMSKTPSDARALHNIREDVRKKILEMKG